MVETTTLAPCSTSPAPVSWPRWSTSITAMGDSDIYLMPDSYKLLMESFTARQNLAEP
jgi:hypothetical protein